MQSQTTILHLSYDVLRMIILLVVASDGGATFLARALATCRGFYKFRDDEEVLKYPNFEKISLPESVLHFQHVEGLLVKCVEAGNSSARYVLAQVLLVTFSQISELRESKLLGTGQASSSRAAEQDSINAFFSYFRKKRPIGSNSNGSKFNHFDLVWHFVRDCDFLDFVSMLPHVENYVKCFGTFLNQKGVTKLVEKFRCMLATIEAVVDFGKQRRTRLSEPNTTDPEAVVRSIREMHAYHLERRTSELPQSRWEELKRECKYMKEELLIIKNSEEAAVSTSVVPDMEERFFYYAGFDEPVRREIDLRSDPGLDFLWLDCTRLAILYETNHSKATGAFMDIFSIVLN